MGDFLDQANHPTTIYIVNTLNKIRERRMDTNWTTLTAGVDCGMVVREALRQFQSFAGLSPSGNYDFTTEQTLLKYSQDITYGMDPVEEYFIYNYERIYPVANMLSSIVGTLASYGDDLTVEMINKHQADLNELQLEMKKIMEDIEKLQSKSIDSPGRIDDSPIWNQVDTAKGQARRRSLPPPEQREQLINNAGKTVVKRQGKAGNTFKSAVRAGTPVLNRLGAVGTALQAYDLMKELCKFDHTDAGRERLADYLGAFCNGLVVGAATGAVAGAVGGIPGVVIGVAVAVFDFVLVATTGKSIANYMFEAEKWIGVQILTPVADKAQPAFRYVLDDMTNGAFSQLGLPM